MQATSGLQTTSGSNVAVIVWSIIGAAIVIAVMTGVKIPVIGNGKGAFFALALVGMQLCGKAFTIGFLPHNPITWVGVALGVFNLLLVAAVIFRLHLPLITTERAATLALGLSMAAKVVLAMVRAALA